MTRSTGVLCALAALAAASLLASPAAAQVYNPLTAEDVAQLLKDRGFTASIEPRKGGDGEYVNTKLDGVNYWVHFDDCDDAGSNCKAIVFDAGFQYAENSTRPDLKKINDWNEYNLGKAGLDSKGDPWINIEVNIIAGVTRPNLIETLNQWTKMLKDFTAFVDWTWPT